MVTVSAPHAAWDVHTAAGDFPADGLAAEQLRFLLRYATLAPSVHNTQPWRFRLAGEAVTLLADRSRQLPAADPEARELLISCGAALYHLRLALRRHGLRDDVCYWPEPAEPEAVARVQLGEPVTPAAEDALLFAAIAARRTARTPLEERRPAPAVVAALRAAARAEGAWLHTVSSERARRDIAALIAEGEQYERADITLQRERSRWAAGSILTFATAHGIATEPWEIAAGTPLLAVLETEGNHREDWLSAGQALARVLLRAAAEGVQASFLNQPLHHSGLRGRLRDIIGGSDHPQLILRLGYRAHAEPATRRPLAEVLEVAD